MIISFSVHLCKFGTEFEASVCELCLHMLHNQVDRHLVWESSMKSQKLFMLQQQHLIFSATRYDDVCMLHGRSNVVVVRGLHVVLVLLHHLRIFVLQ